MTVTIMAKALTLWAVLSLVAIINGVFREKALIPFMGTFAGLITSGILLSGCIFLVAYYTTPWYGRPGSSQYWIIGLLWLLLTLIFEFGFGHFVAHKDWPDLLQAYTFKGGNLWPIVLVVTLISPWLAARIQGLV